MNELAAAVIRHIESLEVVTQGRGAGKPFEVFPWESDFIGGAPCSGCGRCCAHNRQRQRQDDIVNAAIAHAALCGPLSGTPWRNRGGKLPRFEQSRLIFDHVCSFHRV